MEIKKQTENRRLTSPQNQTVTTSTTLGSGTVTSILGKGGYATVYEIWNPKLEVRRAVKLWHPEISQKSLERFETEIKITAKLHHPNIVEIHTVGEWNKIPYIEMEKIDGGSLRDLLSKSDALPVEVATAISILICRALTYAHRQTYHLYGVKRKGIIHCDIKPANIMITREGIVKLTDFGLATPPGEQLHDEGDTINGSLQYSSPEQLKGMQVDIRTDIYSLGVVMYEMYSGIKTFTAKSLQELVQKRLKDIHTPLHELCRDLNPAIKKMIKKCISYDQTERYESAQSLLSDLEKIFYKMTKENPERIIYRYLVTQGEYRDLKHHSRRLKIIVSSTLILATLLFFIFYFIGRTLSNDDKQFEPGYVSQNTQTTDSQSKQSEIKPGASNEKVRSVTNKKINTASKENIKNKSTTSRKTSLKNTAAAVPSQSSKNAPVSGKGDTSKVRSDESVLETLTTSITKGDYATADQILKQKPINDGEYFFLNAQFLGHKGKWQEGLAVAEKGLKLPSKRLSPDQHRTLYQFSKAKCLSARYKATGIIDDGQKAMEAWFDVKYTLKANATDPMYLFADSEIRRINETLQNGSSQQP